MDALFPERAEGIFTSAALCVLGLWYYRNCFSACGALPSVALPALIDAGTRIAPLGDGVPHNRRLG
jgi:hypothetical protein